MPSATFYEYSGFSLDVFSRLGKSASETLWIIVNAT